jgi:hypothetical protein
MQWDEPGFVATIGDAPATVDAPTAVLEPPTREWAAPPPAPRPRPQRPRRVMSRLLLIAITAGFALYVAGVGGELFSLLRGGAAARTVPAEGGSLLRAVAFEAALKGLPPGRIEALRVAADRLDARVVVDGRVRVVRVTDTGRVTDLPAPERPTGTTLRVDTRAPARIVRAATRRTGRGAASVSHLALEGRRWQLTFTDGAQFSADRHGRGLRRG